MRRSEHKKFFLRSKIENLSSVKLQEERKYYPAACSIKNESVVINLEEDSLSDSFIIIEDGEVHEAKEQSKGMNVNRFRQSKVGME